MYDYLAKVILLGPSGSGKYVSLSLIISSPPRSTAAADSASRSCLLHRFVKNECTLPLRLTLSHLPAVDLSLTKHRLTAGRVLTSQTIGVEFASKIVRVGTGARRPRVKLQLWDTAGTERFRSVSRSYYRGAAGAVLVYDVASRASFDNLPTFLNDARALAGPDLTLLLAGNKMDVDGSDAAAAAGGPPGHLLDGDEGEPLPSPASSRATTMGTTSAGSAPSSLPSNPPAAPATTGHGIGTRLTATVAPQGREVSASEAARWAAASGVPVAVEVSALDGSGVDALFERLARTILAKIELGEIDPDDPASGIQYGDVAWGEMDGGSVRSGLSGGGDGGVRRRGGRRRAGTGGWGGMREWEAVFRLDRRKRSGCC